MIDVIRPLIKQFMPFAQERMGFKEPPRMFVRRDTQNAQNPLGKTAYYDPAAKSVTLYISGRHPKDVMRSLSHELVHHAQNCNGEFDNVGEMGEGYAQKNPHLREMERQAYEIGNLCFRDWEDSIKQTIYFEHLQKGVEKVMSTKDWKNKEVKSLLSEAWGFKMDLSKLNEGSGPSASDGIHTDDEDIEGKDPSGKSKGWEKRGLDEMGGCPDHELEDDEIVVMQNGDEGAPEDPNALVDELGGIVDRLQSALGGAEPAEDEIMVDMAEEQKYGGNKGDIPDADRKKKGHYGKGQKRKETADEEGEKDFKENLRRALRKALLEAGRKDTGASKGDKGKDKKDPEAKDYEHGGDREGDKSKTHPGTDYSGHHPHHKISGESDETKRHYEDNAENDEDRLKDMKDLVARLEDHIRALTGDKEYDEELDERRARGRKGPHIRGVEDPRLREAIKRALKASIVKK